MSDETELDYARDELNALIEEILYSFPEQFSNAARELAQTYYSEDKGNLTVEEIRAYIDNLQKFLPAYSAPDANSDEEDWARAAAEEAAARAAAEEAAVRAAAEEAAARAAAEEAEAATTLAEELADAKEIEAAEARLAEAAAREELEAREETAYSAEVARLLAEGGAREVLQVPDDIRVAPDPVVGAEQAVEQELAEAATEAYAAAGRANSAADNAEFAGQNAANNSGVAEEASAKAFRNASEAAAAAELAKGAAGAAEAAADNATEQIIDVRDAAIAAIAQSSKRAAEEELGDGWMEPTPPPSPPVYRARRTLPETPVPPSPEPAPVPNLSDDEEVGPLFSLDATIKELGDNAASVIGGIFSDGGESLFESSDDEGGLGLRPAPRPVPEAVPRPESGRVPEAVSMGFGDPLVEAVRRRRAAMAAS